MPHEHTDDQLVAWEIQDDVMRIVRLWASFEYPPVQTVGVAASTLLETLIDILDEKHMEEFISKIHEAVERYRAKANEIKGESNETVH